MVSNVIPFVYDKSVMLALSFEFTADIPWGEEIETEIMEMSVLIMIACIH